MRQSYIEINTENLINNLNVIRSLSGNSSIVAMVKANAYGHGMEGCAKIFRQQNVEYLGVAFTSEGIKLRQNGDIGNILLTVPAPINDAEDLLKYKLETAIGDFSTLEAFSNIAVSLGSTIDLHLFVNTGMNRDGLKPKDALELLLKAETMDGVNIKGIMTHLTSSEDINCEFNKTQLSVFHDFLTELKNRNKDFDFLHSSNSGSVINYWDNTDNMVRPGLSLYGYYNDVQSASKLGLKPTLSLKSKVLAIQTIKKGETTGYGLKYIANETGNIAVIPLGYGDGFPYILTNTGHCLLKGKRYPIVGSVCMDLLMVYIGEDKIIIGDEAVFIGEQGREKITVYELAEKCHTIVYDITSAFTDRLPRVYV